MTLDANSRIRVTSDFVQGDYLFKLVGAGGQESYIPLTVWDPTSTATYLVKNDVFTWQAWNPYGGYDFYAGVGPCPADVYPLCSRARIVSYDRPYGYGEGAGDFLGSEYPFVRFVEQHGLDVAYVTDSPSNSTRASCCTTRPCSPSVTTSAGRSQSDRPQ